jgi:lipoate-protein ligase A
MNWRFIDSGFCTAQFNMRFDESLAREMQGGTTTPTLRVYGWRPPAISIGRNQDIADFDHRKLREEGIDIVRRPTGGRAILHSQELTYSVVMPALTIGPREIYRTVSGALVRGLLLLGIEAELTGNDDLPRKPANDAASVPCFSSSAKYELQYHGKKLVGSAQRRFGNVVLQHGSVLLGKDHLRILDFMKARGVGLGEYLFSRTIDVGTILGRCVSFEEAAEAFKKGFQEALSITFV